MTDSFNCGAPTRTLSLIVFGLWSCLISSWLFSLPAQVIARSDDNCVACHVQQKDKAGEVVAIYRTSTHSRVSVGCTSCHGGDSSQSEKSGAHGARLIARPDTGGTLEMCGKCHRQPLEFFKSSRHVAAQPNAGRLDCVECHGVHGIGAASQSFRWSTFCGACHGLEYLPQLTKPFREMLALADELSDGLHSLEKKGRARAEELIRRRKEIRHLTSELVHKTDGHGEPERIRRILELGSTLKEQIAAEEKR